MRLSKLAITKNKIMNEDNVFSQDILLKMGQLFQFCSGIYAYDHILYKVMQNVKDVIRKHLDKIDCVEVCLPILQPESIWEASGRLKQYVDEDVMYRTQSSAQKFCLAPTAEEAIVEFLRNRLNSYKSLPVTFYQIGTKFRNEIRTKGYLIRGKAFEMMDAYSFGKDMQDLLMDYDKIKDVYIDIFRELNLDVIPVGADTGNMGGKKSEEFMIISNLGEDTIFVDKNSHKAFNSELLDRLDAQEYLNSMYGIDDINKLTKCRSLELGHIFQLGTKYSDSMNAGYVDDEGNFQPYYMGCYGIGVSRVVAVVYESNKIVNDKNEIIGFSLPYNLAPYKVQIIYGNIGTKEAQANEFYQKLLDNGVNALLDDRQELMFGARIKDANLLGTPYLAVLGNKIDDNMVEIENTKTKEKQFLKIDDAVKFFCQLNK